MYEACEECGNPKPKIYCEDCDGCEECCVGEDCCERESE